MFLNTLIKEQPESPKSADRILQLADLMKNVIRNENASHTLYKGFLEKYPNHTKAEEVKKRIGIAGSSIPLIQMVENLAANMYDDSLHQFNESAATQYVDASEALSLIHIYSNLAVPDMVLSLRLLTFAGNTILSCCLRNLGPLGKTINSFCVNISFSK